ncbi:hypothetical protein B4N89_32970 [Embleya scabrispora]|uniref:Carbonyl reductase n=1 Tax=Embleya scabrispora TaxID=159449 RepID=A0A1T3NQC5_9ACTN|nr:SDR family NAD(P)-dependent oxidoreductase [Embleya scabrispora]OPC78930.1 hypothetical protein B4N89_32970 [Embleya scabrispora]
MSKTAIVTGGTGRLGLAVLRGLCRRLAADDVVYLTARDLERGRATVDLLRREGFAPRLAALDLCDPAGAEALADTVAARHGGVDILIGGAGARIDLATRNQDQVGAYIATNNHGTRRLIEAFAPRLRDGARFVCVVGDLGGLRHLPHRLRARFDVDRVGLADLSRVMDDYVRAVQDGRSAAQGWPAWIGVPSAIGTVAAVKVLARELAEDPARRDIVVNVAYVGRPDPAAPGDAAAREEALERAAADVVWLATLPAGTLTPHAELVRERTALPFRA